MNDFEKFSFPGYNFNWFKFFIVNILNFHYRVLSYSIASNIYFISRIGYKALAEIILCQSSCISVLIKAWRFTIRAWSAWCMENIFAHFQRVPCQRSSANKTAGFKMLILKVKRPYTVSRFGVLKLFVALL